MHDQELVEGDSGNDGPFRVMNDQICSAFFDYTSGSLGDATIRRYTDPKLIEGRRYHYLCPRPMSLPPTNRSSSSRRHVARLESNVSVGRRPRQPIYPKTYGKQMSHLMRSRVSASRVVKQHGLISDHARQVAKTNTRKQSSLERSPSRAFCRSHRSMRICGRHLPHSRLWSRR